MDADLSRRREKATRRFLQGLSSQIWKKWARKGSNEERREYVLDFQKRGGVCVDKTSLFFFSSEVWSTFWPDSLTRPLPFLPLGTGLEGRGGKERHLER